MLNSSLSTDSDLSIEPSKTTGATSRFESSQFDHDDIDDAFYMAVSRAAVAGLILGLLAVMSIWFVPLILLPVVGLVCGIIGLKSIRSLPNELTGAPIALGAIVLNGFFLLLAPSLHAYTYLTEVPDGYVRASFTDLKSDGYSEDYPPPSALELDGKNVFLKGYIHPTSIVSGAAQKFILVPDLGTCCFGGQPKLTHMVEITLTGDTFARYAMRQVKVAGTLHVDTQLKPIAELQGVYYQMNADVYRGN